LIVLPYSKTVRRKSIDSDPEGAREEKRVTLYYTLFHFVFSHM